MKIGISTQKIITFLSAYYATDNSARACEKLIISSSIVFDSKPFRMSTYVFAKWSNTRQYEWQQ